MKRGFNVATYLVIKDRVFRTIPDYARHIRPVEFSFVKIYHRAHCLWQPPSATLQFEDSLNILLRRSGKYRNQQS